MTGFFAIFTSKLTTRSLLVLHCTEVKNQSVLVNYFVIYRDQHKKGLSKQFVLCAVTSHTIFNEIFPHNPVERRKDIEHMRIPWDVACSNQGGHIHQQ